MRKTKYTAVSKLSTGAVQRRNEFKADMRLMTLDGEFLEKKLLVIEMKRGMRQWTIPRHNCQLENLFPINWPHNIADRYLKYYFLHMWSQQYKKDIPGVLER